MIYEMKVRITNPNTQEEMYYKLECYFVYDKEQYGNGFFLSIEGKGFSPQDFDLRYDRSFRKSEKEKWLENWARNYWSGENGAWAVKSLEITKKVG